MGDTNGVVSVYNMATIVEKHSNFNNNFQVSENTATFATEIETSHDEFVLQPRDIVQVRLFRAHYSAIIDLRVDQFLNPKILMTSSQDCEVFIWDLFSKKEGALSELIQVGSLVIKGSKNSWNITPDKEQKLLRDREIKNTILNQAIKIRNAIHKEYSIFNKVREYEESGILDEVTKNLEQKMREKDIDLRFIMKTRPEQDNKKLMALAKIKDNWLYTHEINDLIKYKC